MHDSSYQPNVSRTALWFGVFGGLTAWALHLTIGYLLVYNGCMLGLATLRMWLLVITVAFGLVTLAAIASSYFTWRRTSPRSESAGEVDYTRIHFTSILGMWLSGISFLALVLVTIPILFLQICG